MKVCPRCQKTYTDDNLNFCLEDGSVLTQSSASAPPPTDPILINQTRPPAPPTQPGAPAGWGSAPQQFSMQPPAKKGSKTWLWVVGILGLLVLVCGGGLVGFFAWVASQDTNSRSNYSFNSGASPSPTANSTTTTTNSTSGRTSVQSIDMSRWVQDFSVGGNTEYTNGEFIISSKEKTYYYVLVARDTYAYEEADVSITVRNIDDAASTMGYGLIFHSNPTPLTQDYAFLIDTKKKRYRVVRHEPQKETSVVAWTNSPKINGGTEANVLEARDNGDNVDLYINGEKVTSIKNTHGYSDGVPGVYSGNAVRAAFSKLEVRK